MVESVRELFEQKAAQSYDPRLKSVHATYRFQIEGNGTWHADVDDGHFEIHEGPTEKADCIIECTEHDFLRIVRGEQNLLTAFMQGRIRIRGDLALVLRFRGLLRAPPSREATNPNQTTEGTR